MLFVQFFLYSRGSIGNCPPHNNFGKINIFRFPFGYLYYVELYL